MLLPQTLPAHPMADGASQPATPLKALCSTKNFFINTLVSAAVQPWGFLPFDYFFPVTQSINRKKFCYLEKRRDKFVHHYSFLDASKSETEAQLRVHLLCAHLALVKTLLLLQPRKSAFSIEHKTKYPPNPTRNASSLLPLASLTQGRDKFNRGNPRFLWRRQDLVEKINHLSILTFYLHFTKSSVTTLVNNISFLCPSVVSKSPSVSNA